MRRRRAGHGGVGRRGRWTATVGLAAAGEPAGVDGDLVNGWPAVGEPTSFTPPAGVCHRAEFADSASRDDFAPVDCGQSHLTETIHVGTFTGAAASASAPPAKGTAHYRAAYGECDRRARRFLGQDFRYGRLWLGVTLPSAAGWRGGSRWYRCELGEATDVENYQEGLVTRSASLKGALTGTSPLALTCYQVKAGRGGDIDSMKPAACNRSHNSEFAGVHVVAGSAYPSKPADWTAIHTGCRKVIARFARVPDDGDLKYRTGTVVVPAAREDWLAGNRGVRCYLYLSDRTFTKSLKGAGTRGLPIRYA